MPDHVNGCVTNAVSSASTCNLGSAPAQSQAEFALAVSNALAGSAHNASSTQLAGDITQGSSLIAGIANLFAVDTAVLASSIATIDNS